MDDRELIKLYRETKDEAYFNKLYNRYSYLKKGYLYENGNDPEYESLFNVTFLNVIGKFDLDKNVKFITYLIASLKNKAKSLKTSSYARHTADISFEDYLEDVNNHNKHSYSIEDIICLPEDNSCDRVYEIFYDLLDSMYPFNEVRRNDIMDVCLFGKTCSEIARERGVSVQAVNAPIVKFKKKLKLKLKQTHK